MNTLSACVLISADPSVGRIDKNALSQQTLMEILIDKIENKEKICGQINDSPKDLSKWFGIGFKDGGLSSIVWYRKSLRGSIQLEWLPVSVHQFIIVKTELSGTIDITNLPECLVSLILKQNKFIGSADLTHLPDELISFHLSENLLSGQVDLKNLPQ